MKNNPISLSHFLPDADLLNLIKDICLKGDENTIISLNYQRKKIWVKFHTDKKTEKANRLQTILSKYLRLPIINSMAISGRFRAAEEEATRLLTFRSLGIAAPQVIAVTKNWIAISDVGETLEHYVKSHTLEETARNALLLNAVEALAELHMKGEVHGGSQIRNITYDETTHVFSFIDLEDNPVGLMSLANAQARDLALFLCSVLAYQESGVRLLPALIERYRELAPKNVWERLEHAYHILHVIERCLGWLLQYLGRDARRGIAVTRAFGGVLRKT